MKKESFIGKSREDLVKALSEKRDEIRNIRFGTAGAKSKDTQAARKARKSIARIMTELNK